MSEEQEREGVEVMFTSGLRTFPKATQWDTDANGRLWIYEGAEVIAQYQDREWRAVWWSGMGQV